LTDLTGRRAQQGADASKPALSTAPVTITAYISGIGAEQMAGWDNDVAAAYKQRRPNATITLSPQTGTTAERVEKLVSLVASGSPPDVMDGPRNAPYMVPNGLLDPALDGFVKRDKLDTKQYNQVYFENSVVHDGKVWQLPFRYAGNALALAANRTVFAEAGITLPPADASRPWTWDEYVAAATRLTRRSGEDVERYGLANWGHFVSYPALWGADWLSRDFKTVTCDTPEMQECYTKFGELFTRHRVVGTTGDVTRHFGNANVFNTGKAAILVFGPGAWTTYTREPQVDIAFAPLPKGKLSTPDVGVASLGLPKGTRLAEDAWDVTRFLLEGTRLARVVNQVPASLPAIEPFVRAQLTRLPNADARVITGIFENASGQTRANNSPKWDDILRVLTPAMNDLMAGNVAAVPMLQGLKPELQAIVNR
jgi:ABC-type glycerol-3-phosphate transport system substrate-binding protein